MKPSGLPLLAILGVGFSTGLSADATSPVDYTQRNDPYAPTAGVTPAKKAPETNTTVQEKRVDKAVIERKVAPVGEPRAFERGVEICAARAATGEPQREAEILDDGQVVLAVDRDDPTGLHDR